MADHYQYLASLGMIVFVSAGAAWLLERWGLWRRPGGYLLCLGLLAILASLTFRQSQMYADSETLYRRTIAANPDCWLAHNNLGNIMANRRQFDEAIACCRRALALKPDSEEAHNNLGQALLGCGRLDEAIAHFHKALRIQPNYGQAHYNLAVALSRQGKMSEALAQRREVIRLCPNEVAVLNDTAWMLATCTDARIRDGAEAVELAERAANISGGRDATILGTLAAAYAEAGRFSEAVKTARPGPGPRRATETANVGRRLAATNRVVRDRPAVPPGTDNGTSLILDGNRSRRPPDRPRRHRRRRGGVATAWALRRLARSKPVNKFGLRKAVTGSARTPPNPSFPVR